MTVSIETYLVVALAFAVFAAVTAIGSSLVLGIGFERLRAGFEIVKKQTGYFSDAIFTLDQRVETLEHKTEQEDDGQRPDARDIAPDPAFVLKNTDLKRAGKSRKGNALLLGSESEVIRWH